MVQTSRCHDGTTAGLYGGPGGGATLEAAGAVSGGDFPPWKARLQTALALSLTDEGESGTALERVAAAFEDVSPFGRW
ncbi:L-asparaginase [Natronobacterium gregoryi]|uniref:Asparaginase n=2 Tax=Natronobacterium gregoryi TaxID=44930 RepID=L0AI08_NATGS|nr:L-asparaginase/GlutRNAGln amidotransferase subunit D [Natronobacterium gregoryi SP2]ELY69034.1 Asparaginase [Natronobacterium gregoryi SP2]SFI91181.1 L-asparaginase [Natronobacterium gregoryi]